MRKRVFAILFLFVAINFSAKADEGMWLPYLLNQQNITAMQAEGCKLTPEQIFSFNQASIKDAIVQFGRGCTGELISAEGLLLTNHHCGLSQVQEHSSPEHDYLTNGFWAYNKNEELPNPGLNVSFLINVEDVTGKVLEGITDNMLPEERKTAIAKAMKSLKDNAEKKEYQRIDIIPFYSGNQYIQFTYDVYDDVRLVGCPPWGIGKFGADTDNWTWPRHKGDFCLFRVYTAPDGTPAKYATENIPMKSKHFFPISLNGIQEGDYAMILGYPGSTDRYLSSQGADMIIKNTGPSIIKCRTEKLNIFRTHMDADPEIFIKYASKQASVSNYWKYYIGQVKQLQRNKVVEKKQAIEKQFDNWVKTDSERTKKYGQVLSDFSVAYMTLRLYENALVYHREAGLRGSEAITFASQFTALNKAIVEKNETEIQKRLQDKKSAAEKYFKDYDFATDHEVTKALLLMFYNDMKAEMNRNSSLPDNTLSPNFIPSLLKTQGDKNSIPQYVDNLFKKSIFTSQERFEKWQQKPYDLKKDPIFVLMNNLFDSYRALQEAIAPAQLDCDNARRLFMAGLMEMQPEKTFYPDANFTMRLTYGTVESYSPADAVVYDYETTLAGVMEKEIPGNWEFDVPASLKKIYETKNYGNYAEAGKDLIVNFITTNDITGGNSGSPVIDGNGNLIGLAFDGNWEAMSGDISFEQQMQRTICMDARYLLLVIDKIANAQNLMKELVIIE